MHLSTYIIIFIFIKSFQLTSLYKTTTTKIENIAEDTIVNPHNFNYILNPGDNVCGKNNGKDLFLLVYVHSSPNNFKRRLAIRETWSNMYKPMRILFMMGHIPDENLTSLLNYEYSLYGDIVQEDFYDCYRNLTYKGIMSLKWITQYCSNVKYVLKVDDDIIVNIFTLWRHLVSLDSYKIIKNKTIMCNVWSSMKIIRDKDSKWYLTEDEIKGNYFGRYCSGSAFVLTSDLAMEMYNISKYVKFFWVDDYYISGLLARASNATYHRFNQLYVINSAVVKEQFFSEKIQYLVFGHVPISLNIFYDIWTRIFTSQLEFIHSLPSDQIRDFKNVIRNFKWSVYIFEPYFTFK